MPYKTIVELVEEIAREQSLTKKLVLIDALRKVLDDERDRLKASVAKTPA